MDKRQGRPARLEIGMVVVRTPQTIFEEEHGKEIRRPRQGQVDYTCSSTTWRESAAACWSAAMMCWRGSCGRRRLDPHT